MVQQWDPLKASSKLQFMQHPLSSIEMFLTDGKLLIKLRKPNNTPMQSHSWENPKLSGIAWPNQEIVVLGQIQWVPITPILLASAWTTWRAQVVLRTKKGWDKFARKMDGTSILSQSLSTIKKFTPPWKSHSRESDLHKTIQVFSESILGFYYKDLIFVVYSLYRRWWLYDKLKCETYASNSSCYRVH